MNIRRKKILTATNSSGIFDNVENITPEDYAGGYTEWEEVASKSVKDSDGFMTDYTLWFNPFTEMYVCTFGDKDIYYPENADYDAEFELYDEAMEWFDDYEGFEDVDECNNIEASKSSEKVTGDTWQSFLDNLELKTGLTVDSSYRRRYNQWIELYDDKGGQYDAEITRYFDGGYELMLYNISKIN